MSLSSALPADKDTPIDTRLPQLQAQPVFENADLIVAYLHDLGVEYVYGVPGGAIEPFYNALARSGRQGGPRAVVARHESGAAFMADGYARETGKLGVCISTSGPGITNMITGVACAFDNSVPLLVITGQPPLHSFGKNALQESSCTGINAVAMLQHCTKYNSLVSHPDQLKAKLGNAILQALQAPQGPAHLSIPVDLLRTPSKWSRPDAGDFTALLRAKPSSVDLSTIAQLQGMLEQASRPVFFIGGGCGDAIEALMQLVHITNALFITTPDGKGFINPRHQSFRGVFGLGGHESARALLASQPDLIVAFGTSFGEFNSHAWCEKLLNSRLVHVDSNDKHFMHSSMARLHVRGRIKSVCEQLIALMPQEAKSTVRAFVDKRSESREEPARVTLDEPEKFHSSASPIKPQRLMKALSEHFPPSTRFVADNGHSAIWAVHCLQPQDRRLTRWSPSQRARQKDQRSAGASWLRVTMDFAPMGWAIGAAIGIASGNPRCPVVCITGDGSYLMNGQEITVAAAQGLTVIFVVLNDAALGMVKHGQRMAGAEPIGFELPQIDYRLMAQSMGIPGHVISSPEDLEKIDFNGILLRPGPTLLDVRIDAEEPAPMGMRLKTLGTASG
jgi:acetolactate synthase I/II/III large subunit